jgi:hypothetical protein
MMLKALINAHLAGEAARWRRMAEQREAIDAALGDLRKARSESLRRSLALSDSNPFFS